MFFYRLLLHLYPSSYRADYGEEMSAIFARELRDADGILEKCATWLAAVAEIIANAAILHFQITKRDLNYSLRSLLRSPSFSITALLLIMIGIGANTSVFTLADFVFVRPLPFPHPDRLAEVWEDHPGYSEMELSPINYRDWKNASSSFANLAAYFNMPVNMVGEGAPERLDGCMVTGDLFSVLGRATLLGRYFTADDDRAGAPGTVVLSYGLWQRLFGGEASVLGKIINLDNQHYTVIGIMPADFHFPDRDEQLWTPMRFNESDPMFLDRTNNLFTGVARLKPGISVAQARTGFSLIAAQLRKQYPKEEEGVGATVLSLRDHLSRQSRLLLYALCGAALCILVIVCANLANLLLARSLARQKELSIRVALGANRRQIVRQLVTDGLLLGLVGGIGAVGIAVTAMPLLARLTPTNLPTAQAPSLDGRMLLFALGVTLFTVLAFSLVPALRACRNAGVNNIREGVRTGTVGQGRLRSVLVVSEIVVSVVLLVSSVLLIRALWRVRAIDPGFQTNGVLTLRTALPLPKYANPITRKRFYDAVLGQVRALPGVTDAAYVTWLPMTMGGGIWPVTVNGQPDVRTAANSASLRFATPGFFATLSIPIESGRDVSESDTSERPYVAVVSESFVRRYWPNQQALGKHFQFALHDREIVGIVGDVHVRGLERASEPQVYIPYNQVSTGDLPFYSPKDLAIHSSSPNVQQLLPAIRRIIARADPEQPISNVRMLDEIVADQTESRAVQVRVLVVFTAVAVLLAGLGIYGLLSFAVSLRQQEFGIRMALGARRGDIFGIVLRQATALALVGLLFGLALAYCSARVLQSLLAGIKPGDAATFTLAAVTCFVTMLLGSVVPAIRAVRVDPTTVMRVE